MQNEISLSSPLTQRSQNSHESSLDSVTFQNIPNLSQTLRNPIIVRNFNNEYLLLICLMIALFFVNIYSIIKSQIIKTINNVFRKIWRKVISYPINEEIEEKTQINNKFNINCCAICLNEIKFEVSVSCFHRFCGIINN